MKKKLLNLLICPCCGSELKLEVYLQNKNEIIEGKLYCSCKQNFPIIKGVPRLLRESLRRSLKRLYPEFFNRYSDLLEAETFSRQDLIINKQKKATMGRFGYEWTVFSGYNCDNFSAFISSLPSGFLRGKLGLDVGCGAGRHAYRASREGAEIIAVDISQSVDAAYNNNRDNDFVHIVQADIYRLPFMPETFQFIYSLGVLHHLPEPKRGYLSLIPFIKQGGSIFIWVYAYTFRKVALELLRLVSCRLSNKNIKRMAYLCNLVDYGIFINLYRFLSRLPSLGKYINNFTPLRIKEYAGYGYGVCYADWFDRLSAPITNYYKKDEINNWILDSGLINTKIQLLGDSWWWLYGERGSK